MGIFNKIFSRKKENKIEELEIEELEKNNEISQDEKTESEPIVEKLTECEVELSTEAENKIENKNILTSLKEKLIKSRTGLFDSIKNIFVGKDIINGELYDDLEDILVQSDIGIEMTLKIMRDLKAEIKSRGIKNPDDIHPTLKDVLASYLIDEKIDLEIEPNKMNVILVVGVNGVGKTTTIGKIASKLVKEGKKVLIGAADTFRAAAVEQLEEWAKRAGAEIVKHPDGADPGSVVFDTLKVGEDKGVDVIIIDTAGRLHNKGELMQELEKINNIIKKKLGEQSYESLLVIDGTTGQNGLTQAKVFNEVTELTGFIVTKLDGTAKGGVLFSISSELKKPIKYIGVGEGVDDLRKFDSKEYIDAIFD